MEELVPDFILTMHKIFQCLEIPWGWIWKISETLSFILIFGQAN